MNDIVTPGQHEQTLAAIDRLPRKVWTTEELVHLTEIGVFTAEDRFELLDGEIVPMSPISRRHEVVTETIERFMRNRETPEFHVVNERQLNLAGNTFCKPDIFVKLSSMLAYDARGDTVLLIIEVAKTSLEFDMGRKADTYARFGVRDYWVVDAQTLDVRVHRLPRADGYGDVRDLGPGDTIVPLLLPELALRLADLGLA